MDSFILSLPSICDETSRFLSTFSSLTFIFWGWEFVVKPVVGHPSARASEHKKVRILLSEVHFGSSSQILATVNNSSASYRI
jgi:hypothetical protein